MIRLHGHPHKDAYVDPVEWPKPEAQGHWFIHDGHTAHTHIGINGPMYGEIAGPVVVPFVVKLFHVPGRIAGFYSENAHDIIWDETGTSRPPEMIGEPHGLRTWTGRFTIDPTRESYRSASPHGWFSAALKPVTVFDDGAQTTVALYLPLFSMVDPSVPESPSDGPVLSAQVDAQSAHPQPGEQYGTLVSIYSDYLPLDPIRAPWIGRAGMTGYGAFNLPPAGFEQRADLDLHNGIEGTLLASGSAIGGFELRAAFDPNVLQTGSHKMAIIRTQANRDEQAMSLLVFDVPVGEPPYDPSPLPVTPPPPPVDPLPTWQTVPGATIQQFGTEPRLRICVSADRCFEVAIK